MQPQAPDALVKLVGSGVLFGMIGAAVLFACFIWWIICIIDVLKNDFTNPNNKIIWILVLLLLGPFGLILYLAIGKAQKVGGKTVDRHQEELLSRLRPTSPDKRDFDMRTTPPKAKSTRTVQEILNDKKDICRKCGKQMKLRTANKGENSGKQFWVCSGYPDCGNVIPAS